MFNCTKYIYMCTLSFIHFNDYIFCMCQPDLLNILVIQNLRSNITKLCFRVPTTASSFASRDIIGLAKVGRDDSICQLDECRN